MNEINETNESRKINNEKKLNTVKERALNLSKDYENSLIKELEKQNMSMNLTIQNISAI